MGPRSRRRRGTSRRVSQTDQRVAFGDAVLVPSIVQMDKPKPEPHSQSVKFHEEWNASWRDISFYDIIKRWRKE